MKSEFALSAHLFEHLKKIVCVCTHTHTHMHLLFTLLSVEVRLFHLCTCPRAGKMALGGWGEAEVLGVHHKTPSRSRKHHIVWRGVVSGPCFYVGSDICALINTLSPPSNNT